MTLEIVDVHVESTRLGIDPATGGYRKAPAQAKVIDARRFIPQGIATDLVGVSPEQAAELEPRDFVVINGRRGHVFSVTRKRPDVRDRDDHDDGAAVYFQLGPASDKRSISAEIAERSRRAAEGAERAARADADLRRDSATAQRDRFAEPLRRILEPLPPERRGELRALVTNLTAPQMWGQQMTEGEYPLFCRALAHVLDEHAEQGGDAAESEAATA